MSSELSLVPTNRGSTFMSSIKDMTFNLSGNSVMKDINLRQAAKYAINQDNVIRIRDGDGTRASSTLTMVPTGNVWNQDVNRAKEYVSAFLKDN